MKIKNNPKLVAISGVKNSGKTTLIVKLIPRLISLGLKVATIKHDGHDFKADIPGTDSYFHKNAGAYGSAVFSNNKYMVVKDVDDCDVEELIQCFSEADIILLEGFKNSLYPKIEIVRSGNSNTTVCNTNTLLAVVTDLPLEMPNIPILGLDEIEAISELLFKWACG